MSRCSMLGLCLFIKGPQLLTIPILNRRPYLLALLASQASLGQAGRVLVGFVAPRLSSEAGDVMWDGMEALLAAMQTLGVSNGAMCKYRRMRS